MSYLISSHNTHQFGLEKPDLGKAVYQNHHSLSAFMSILLCRHHHLIDPTAHASVLFICRLCAPIFLIALLSPDYQLLVWGHSLCLCKLLWPCYQELIYEAQLLSAGSLSGDFFLAESRLGITDAVFMMNDDMTSTMTS